MFRITIVPMHQTSLTTVQVYEDEIETEAEAIAQAREAQAGFPQSRFTIFEMEEWPECPGQLMPGRTIEF